MISFLKSTDLRLYIEKKDNTVSQYMTLNEDEIIQMLKYLRKNLPDVWIKIAPLWG